MELKKAREAEEKQKILEEEQKLERRIQEQQERMRLEFEEEQAKKKAKEDAVRSFVTSCHIWWRHQYVIITPYVTISGLVSQKAGCQTKTYVVV